MASGVQDDIAEREFLGSFVKKQIKYGSTSKHILKQQKFITHYVQPSDTLQGLSLRYGVPMEHIKRANKLWTSDSLFLRPTLNIPVVGDDYQSPLYSASSSQASTPVNGHNTLGASSLDKSSAHTSIDCDEVSLSSPTKPSQPGSFDNGRTVHSKDESFTDFLSRIDSSISKTKNQVSQCQEKLATTSDHHKDLLNFNRPSSSLSSRSSLGYGHGQHGSSHSLHSNGSGDIPLTVITGGRKVNKSLRRLERKQDELFEL